MTTEVTAETEARVLAMIRAFDADVPEPIDIHEYVIETETAAMNFDECENLWEQMLVELHATKAGYQILSHGGKELKRVPFSVLEHRINTQKDS